MSSTLLRGGTLITVDPLYPLEFTADLLIKDTKIAQIGADLADADPATEVIDARGKILTPGLTDTHRHVWQSLIRFVGADWALPQYGQAVFGRYGPRYTPADMHLAVSIGLAEALDAGVTQVFDWNHNLNSPAHAEESVRAHAESGMRTVFGYGESAADWLATYGQDSRPAGSYLADVRAAHRDLADGTDRLTTLAMAVRGPEKSPMEIVAGQWALARELGLRISVHVGNGERGKQRAVAKLGASGLLGPDITYVHCCTLADDEIAMIADTGGSASVAPFVEASMGHGPLAIGRLGQAGCEPSLSVDTCTNTGGDMFGVLRAALAAGRADGYAARPDRPEVALTCAQVLAMATINGARANGLDQVSGSLTVGKQADIVMFDTAAPNMFPCASSPGASDQAGSATAAVVLAAHAGNVDTVFVAGRKLKARGELLGIDLPSLRKQGESRRTALLAQ
ncbi:MAG TPA: amidohydrolase family protein [Streptosporangiaceae bacterium]|jgi:cytosine/adenosine deaminase-related metal-dependent hydrolase|nr:amidohydrolase family protein [Streptosporangiaceae bacterium]